ncbi:MAG: DUF72 domain-containing protein [Armatimonadota bacterium]
MPRESGADEPGQVKVGCCGFALRQAEYFATFPVIEVQQTFYKPPREATAQRWREAAPLDFEFTLKAWQLITHEPTSPTYRKARLRIPDEERGLYGSFRPTDEVLAAWEATRGIAQILRARVVVFQCPARFTPTDEHVGDLRRFFQRIERGGLALAWEPRGAWDAGLVRGLCEDLDLVHCVDPFQVEPVAGRLRYFRLHGIGGYRHKYDDDELRQLKRWCARPGPTYCLFNNVAMAEDARRMMAVLGG